MQVYDNVYLDAGALFFVFSDHTRAVLQNCGRVCVSKAFYSICDLLSRVIPDAVRRVYAQNSQFFSYLVSGNKIVVIDESDDIKAVARMPRGSNAIISGSHELCIRARRDQPAIPFYFATKNEPVRHSYDAINASMKTTETFCNYVKVSTGSQVYCRMENGVIGDLIIGDEISSGADAHVYHCGGNEYKDLVIKIYDRNIRDNDDGEKSKLSTDKTKHILALFDCYRSKMFGLDWFYAPTGIVYSDKRGNNVIGYVMKKLPPDQKYYENINHFDFEKQVPESDPDRTLRDTYRTLAVTAAQLYYLRMYGFYVVDFNSSNLPADVNRDISLFIDTDGMSSQSYISRRFDQTADGFEDHIPPNRRTDFISMIDYSTFLFLRFVYLNGCIRTFSRSFTIYTRGRI